MRPRVLLQFLCTVEDLPTLHTSDVVRLCAKSRLMTPATRVLLVLQEVLLTLKDDEACLALQLLRFTLMLHVLR